MKGNTGCFVGEELFQRMVRNRTSGEKVPFWAFGTGHHVGKRRQNVGNWKTMRRGKRPFSVSLVSMTDHIVPKTESVFWQCSHCFPRFLYFLTTQHHTTHTHNKRISLVTSLILLNFSSVEVNAQIRTHTHMCTCNRPLSCVCLSKWWTLQDKGKNQAKHWSFPQDSWSWTALSGEGAW